MLGQVVGVSLVNSLSIRSRTHADTVTRLSVVASSFDRCALILRHVSIGIASAINFFITIVILYHCIYKFINL